MALQYIHFVVFVSQLSVDENCCRLNLILFEFIHPAPLCGNCQLLSECLRFSGFFSKVGSGALPISALIYYLRCDGTHRPRNKCSPHFVLFLYARAAVRTLWTPRQRRQSWPLTLPPSSVWFSNAAALTLGSLSVAGGRGSWGRRRPRSLCRAAEADMGRDVSGSTGRPRLIDVNGHDHHRWLQNK